MFEPPFGRVGFCIYCGSRVYSENKPTQKLGDEHIVPLNLGGEWVLPAARCAKCERITSKIETHCGEQMIGQTRDHLGLRVRRRSSLRKSVPVSLDGEPSRSAKVPLDEHPAAMVMFAFNPPAMLLGLPGNAVMTGRIQIRPLTPDFVTRADRVRRVTGRQVNIVRRGAFVALTFGRMLAKIAHAYASAKLGPGNFKPFLVDLIRDTDTEFADRFVGGSVVDDPPITRRHELDLYRERIVFHWPRFNSTAIAIVSLIGSVIGYRC